VSVQLSELTSSIGFGYGQGGSTGTQLAARAELFGFGYDAVSNKGRRKPPDGVLRSEDAELNRTERRKLTSGTRDIHRNFAIAQWMIRKHLDYVTTFRFQPKGPHADWLAAKVREWSKPEHFDIAGRHHRRMFFRLLEARRIIDGDCGMAKILTGHVQAIEGDRICTPYGGPPPGVPIDRVIHGVQVNDVGKAEAYSICKRGRVTDWGQQGIDLKFERMIPAQHMWLHARFDRFDQVRGISPIACALNDLRDTYESLEYIRMRMKLQQLFGLVLYRGDPQSITRESDAESDYETQNYGETIRLNGTKILDLDIGDRAEFLESKAPANETQQFIDQLVGITLKCLDIPFSFFKENFSNYSGSRQALLQYEQSASHTRSENIDLSDDWLDWRLGIAELQGDWPEGARRSDFWWLWIPAGMPWIDPLKEISAEVEALNAQLTSRQRICRERGQDFYQVADELKEERDYLESIGLTTDTTPNADLNSALLAAGARDDA